jgi:hypothetical protein
MIISKPLNVNNNPWIRINVVIQIYSTYTLVNPNIFNYTLQNKQNMCLYDRGTTKLITFVANAT